MKLFLFSSFTTIRKIMLQELTAPVIVILAPISLVIVRRTGSNTNDAISNQHWVT